MDNKQIATTNENKPIEGKVISEAELAEENKLAIIDKTYGSGVPYSKERIVSEISFFSEHAFKSAVEVGKRLILLKEHEPKGEFLKALENIGYNERTAQENMQIVKALGDDFEAFMKIGKSKTLALIFLKKQELQELSDGGEVYGVTLDDVEKMSTTEVRKKMRQERKDHSGDKEALEDIIESEKKKNTALEIENRKLKNITEDWSGQLSLYRGDIDDISTKTITQMNRIKELCTNLGTTEVDERVKLEAENFLEGQLKFMYEHLLDASAIANKHLGIPMVTDEF